MYTWVNEGEEGAPHMYQIAGKFGLRIKYGV